MLAKIKQAFWLLLMVLLASSLLVITINLPAFDEELLEEIQTISAQQVVAEDRNNAIYWLAGLASPEQGELHELGKKVLALAAESVTNEVDAIKKGESPNDVDAWMANYQALTCHTQTEQGCHRKLANEIVAKPITSDRARQLLERYRSLISEPGLHFHSTADYRISLYGMTWAMPLKLQRFHIASALTESDAMATVELLSRDLTFWRMVLRRADTILVKMIASAAIANNLKGFSEHIAATSAINDSLLQAYRASLKQLNVPEWSFANAFVGELIMVDPIFPDTYDLFNGAALVSQNAATKNLMYVSYYKPWTTISSLSPEAYFELLQKCQNEQVTEPRCLLDMEAKINPVTILYNPFGKMMASFTHIGFKNYLSRVHDLNGLILLINAQLSLKVSGAELSQQAVDALSYKNPYTNEPFQWNETTRQLSFICIGDKPFCSITL